MVPVGAFCPCPGSESNKNGCALANGNPKKNTSTGRIQILFNYIKFVYL